MRWPRLTVRLRLTLLYGLLFFLAGAVLLTINYSLVRQSLNEEFGSRDSVPITFQTNTSDEKGLTNSPEVTIDSEQVVTTDGRTFNDVITDYRSDILDEALESLLLQSAIALTLTGLAAVLLGWIVAGRVLRPVREITAAAQRASETNLSNRVNLDGPRDELRDLADTFDGMLDRLEVAFQSQRHFAAQASHELRTPISIIQAEADVALAAPDATDRERELATSVRTAATRGERLIASLLTLARSESTMLDQTALDLAEIVGNEVGELAPRADAAGVRLDLQLVAAPISGDRELIRRLAGNLVENAIIHNIPEGWAEIIVQSDDRHAILQVTNSGPTISADEIDELLAPFQRQSTDRRGFGLGLAIVQSIVTSHHGQLHAKPRSEGGLTITVHLPITDS